MLGSTMLRKPSRSAAAAETAWHAALLRAEEQTLSDLVTTGACEVVFVRHARETSPADFLGAFAERAQHAGFATAEVEVLQEGAFDALDRFVGAVARSLRFAGSTPTQRSRGLAAALDTFVKAQRTGATEELERRLEQHGVTGELADVARSFVHAKSTAKAAVSKLDAWLSGVETIRAEPESLEPLGLSARTAKRAFADLTRLVRALGAQGTVILVRGAETIVALPPARRLAAYTVLRELIDNADGGRGLVATRLVVAGSTSFFQGPRSVSSLAPLAQRLEEPPSNVAAPHRSLIELSPPEGAATSLPVVRPMPATSAHGLATLVRLSHGLPPLEATPSLSVGNAAIDASIDALFEHSSADGSVFALLTGRYGAGKTHFLLHLAARALADRRPIFRLSLERLDMDLGHPERHFARLLEGSTLPSRKGESALDRLRRFTRTDGAAALRGHLERIATMEGDAADAAGRALTVMRKARSPVVALASHLSGRDLERRTGSLSARREAYGRLLLWLALLESADATRGPVLLIDEAENLFRGGATKAERRTALRSLSFYCGGALPRACVVLAITPEALAELKEEAPELLSDLAEQKTILAWEDATLLLRRLRRSLPLSAPDLGVRERRALVEKVRQLHVSVRGRVDDERAESVARELCGGDVTPREIARRTVARLEALWWNGSRG